ncbi:glycosyltransferase family 2 protein [Streptacidiphilus carbonis]|uniref:glycosyltransferase family 2 protein n=1 Tax=Streptacidiphilus carbonis TaxID=105422 RepID=UPI0005A801DD|nr:glycosyltransferase [Streptacidiphilus carbonis]
MSGRPLLDPALAPIEVVDLDLPAAGAAPRLRRAGGDEPASPTGSVLALVRSAGRPIGMVQADLGPSGAGDPAAALAELAHRQLAAELADPAAPAPRPTEQPLVTVVIATRERPQLLARCLESLAAQRYPRFETVVVDNAPATDATRDLVKERFGDTVRYVREPLRGLASAHNAGVAAALGEITAFTDDDVVIDAGWIEALVAGFADPAVGCVTGLILPAALHTATQVLLEAHGGFGKGFRARRFQADRPPADQPLFPFTAGRLGSGANMAFRTGVLRELGGFDAAVGTGTPAKGGDDLLSFFRAVVHGHALLYQPEALVWHHHRDRAEDLDAQAFGYGAGLGAYLAAAVANEPRMLPALLRRVPGGVRHAIAHTGADATPADWPARLIRLQRRGMLYGPIGYLRSRRIVRKAQRDVR